MRGIHFLQPEDGAKVHLIFRICLAGKSGLIFVNEKVHRIVIIANLRFRPRGPIPNSLILEILLSILTFSTTVSDILQRAVSFHHVRFARSRTFVL